MMKINSYLANYISKDYGAHVPEHCILDCSLGCSAVPLPSDVMERLCILLQETVKSYPHDETLLGRLVQRFFGVAPLQTEHFILGNGSYDLLCNVNLLCLCRGKKVLGHAPQFPAYVDHVNCIGAEYCCYQLDEQRNYRFDPEGYLSMMKEEYDLFILENPNNPTGQIIELCDLERIAARALSLDTVLVVDEAYGDYMPLSNSAACLVKNYPNVFVTRSFSKGFGMAGARIGYGISSPELITLLKKLVTPFNSNSIARELAVALLDSGADVIQLEQTAKKKAKIIAALHKLNVACTAKNTPIMTLFCSDPMIDLQQLLARVGLATVSCAGYGGMGQNAVRLMICEDVDLLIRLLQQAEALLS